MSVDPTAESDHWGTEVVRTTVLGYPCLTFAKRRHLLSELLLDARRFPEREYLIQDDRRITFAEHERAVERAAAALGAHGVGRGDRVLLLGRNSVDWVISFWAVLHTGAVVVLGNAWWSDAELAHGVTTSDPRLVLADANRLAQIAPERDSLSFAELIEQDPQTVQPMTSVDENDAAIILFTSGTTGLPKGAVLSHHGILSTMHSIALRTNRLPSSDGAAPPPSKALLSLPLFHIGGLQQVLNPLVTGGTLVFTEGRFDPAAVVDLIEREEIRVWSAVPTMVTRVADYLDESGRPPVRALRTLGLGGAPVLDQLRQRVLQTFPNAVRGLAVTYGSSEAGGVVSTGAGAEVRERPGTVGRPLATAEVRIDSPDETGAGEVLVRSPSVMLGYWTGADAGAEHGGDDNPVTPDRWLRTGDIGRLDADGYLYITDRTKDIVIRGGENIATPHVESRLLEHPAVKEAAVVGLPHPSLGEELGAVVVLHDDAGVVAGDLAEFAREALAYFEVPTKWWFRVGPLPQNTTGKVLKRQLRNDWIDRRGSDATIGATA